MTEARETTLALGGRWYGHYGAAPCPVCQPEGRKEQNALTLANGRAGLLAHCKKSECSFRDIAAAATVTPSTFFTAPDPAAAAQRETERRADANRRERQARALWDEAQPVSGTLAEDYLRGRGITCPLTDNLRFHPSCWHPTARRLPAMVALVQGASTFAVHRTYLRPDGGGKADAEPAKAMLGGTAGGAVQLAEGPERLLVGEGIESTLSLLCGLLDELVTACAALSTSGLRGLHLPSHPGQLTIAADGDAPGRSAAHALAERAYRLGWQVGIIDPGNGTDWNDVLTGKAVAT